MARLPRLVVPGQAHYVVQRGHGSRPVFTDDADRAAFLGALREAAAGTGVLVHAFALAPAEVQLLVTPPTAEALSRLVQRLGRRYVSAYNRRHGCVGTLWSGRFRGAVVEPGELRLAALTLIDGQPGAATSAGGRTGGAHDALVSDPPEYWQLGNTPFERELAYRARLAQGVPPVLAQRLREAALGGWAAGSDAFVRSLAAPGGRPLRPRPRGRPANDRPPT